MALSTTTQIEAMPLLRFHDFYVHKLLDTNQSNATGRFLVTFVSQQGLSFSKIIARSTRDQSNQPKQFKIGSC